jgi:hypothetical protein
MTMCRQAAELERAYEAAMQGYTGKKMSRARVDFNLLCLEEQGVIPRQMQGEEDDAPPAQPRSPDSATSQAASPGLDSPRSVTLSPTFVATGTPPPDSTVAGQRVPGAHVGALRRTQSAIRRR